MIKSFLLNNLLVPLRQISAPILLASATLHGLLFLVPISSNSTDVDGKAKGTEKVSKGKDVCDEDDSLSDLAGEDSLSEDKALCEHNASAT